MSKLSIQEVCVSWPPYRAIRLYNSDWTQLRDFEFYDGHIDCYCVKCKGLSVFKTSNDLNHPDFVSARDLQDHNFSFQFICSRNSGHQMWFFFRLESEILQKVGQWPSLGDLHIKELDKYTTVINDDDRTEFARAIGLAAHDVGIGSFVYLRRIFERRIEAARAAAAKESAWDQAAYEKSRVSERIKLLSKFLPDTLVKNAGIYSILSLGVHELSEEDCRANFDTLRVGIELIFDDMLREKEKAEKSAVLEKAVQAMQSKLTSGK